MRKATISKAGREQECEIGKEEAAKPVLPEQFCMECKTVLGQAKKSTRGMPWHWEPMKGAAICEKPRGAESRP